MVRRRTCGRAATLLRESRLGAAAGAKPSTHTRAAKARRSCVDRGARCSESMLTIEGVWAADVRGQREADSAWGMANLHAWGDLACGNETSRISYAPLAEPFSISTARLLSDRAGMLSVGCSYTPDVSHQKAALTQTNARVWRKKAARRRQVTSHEFVLDPRRSGCRIPMSSSKDARFWRSPR